MSAPTKENLAKYKLYMREQYAKCLADPVYFIRNYCYIQEPIRGRIKFGLFPYQERAVHDFETFDYNVILKGRQIGISTAVACYALWLMLFHKDKNVLVIATKQETAKNLVMKVRFAFDHLPPWLQVPCTENNKLSLKFKNGSQIKASTAAADSGRSEALSLLVLDEAAFIQNAEDIWTAAAPTLATGGRAVLISTPNGVGNFFHKIYTKAETGQKDNPHDVSWNATKLDWRVHPSRDQAWRDQMGAIAGEREARQEYDAEFIGSGNTVIDEYIIEEYMQTKMIEPVAKEGVDRNYWRWEWPNPRGQYIVVADVARGDGSDYSTFHVIDAETVTQVAEYQGKVDTTAFGHMLYAVACEWNNAVLVVERENVGWAVLQTIIDREYNNLFYMSKDLKVVELHRNVSNRYYSEEKKMVPGFGTNMKTRPLIISKIETYMRLKEVEIRSKRLLTELQTFIWQNGKAEAMEGKNDDLVMAMAIGLWVRDTSMKLQQQGTSYTLSALNGIQRQGHDVIYTPNSLRYDPYKMPSPNGHGSDEDLRWLID